MNMMDLLGQQVAPFQFIGMEEEQAVFKQVL
jgi:hypothetical protein